MILGRQKGPLIVIIFNLREVLEDDTCGAERDLGIVLRGLRPVEDGLDVLLLHAEVVAVADGALEENADRVRQAGCTGGEVRRARKAAKLILNLQVRESPRAGSL